MFFKSNKTAELQERVAELEEQLRRYRAALEFYASDANWSGAMKYRDADDSTVFVDDTTTTIMHDKGRMARDALQEDRTEIAGKTQFHDKTRFIE